MLDCVSLCIIGLLLGLFTLAGFILYSGLMSEIIVMTGCSPIKKITFAYKFKQGPYKNCGQLFKESYIIGPKLTCIGVFYDDPKQKRRLCAHPFLEIYREGLIHYMAPLARQDDFYVPEVCRSSEEEHSDSDVSGADSNSEYSSGSGDLHSDSRETSLAGSSLHSVPLQDQKERRCRGRSSGGNSLKDLDGEQWAEREELLYGDSDQESLEAST